MDNATVEKKINDAIAILQPMLDGLFVAKMIIQNGYQADQGTIDNIRASYIGQITALTAELSAVKTANAVAEQPAIDG